jgi:hypothetical protein
LLLLVVLLDADQHRTAYHQLGDDGKEARAKKNAD